MSSYRRPPFKTLLAYWLVALFSTGLVVLSSFALWQDVISFRSCNVNSTDLSVSTCGKSSVNAGDALLSLLFLASVALVISLFTHAIRLSRRPA